MAENKLSSKKKVLILVIVLFALVAALNIAVYLSCKNYPPVVFGPTVEPTATAISTPSPEFTITPTPTPVLIPASTDFFTYSKNDQIFSVSKNEFKVLDKFTVSGLMSLSDECGTNKSEQYFNELLSNYSKDDNGAEYHFIYKGQTQDSGDWIVTVIPNKIGGFKDDFNICEAGADRYPFLSSDKYLIFVSSCGTGADDDSGLPYGCDIVRKIAEPTIKLK